MVGIAKTGVPGFGTLAIPLMVLAVGDARHSAGWLLPLLCVADVFAVALYRRHAYARRLMVLLPWVLLGMVTGAVALGAPERIMRPAVAVIVLAMLAFRWLIRRPAIAISDAPANAATTSTSGTPTGGTARTPATGSWRQAAVYGVAAGFATTIANAAGPIMNLYLLARRLPKEEFVGTGAWFFLVVNLCKLPVYAGHGLIDARSLRFDAMLIPAVVAGAAVGRTLVRRIPQQLFERLVLVLTVVAAAMLFIPK